MDMAESLQRNGSKQIDFKCVESPFFSEFDGKWTVSEIPENKNDPSRSSVTKIEYEVMVRPRGPVPVLALEWRIKEDVPRNLIAVKAAAMSLGKDGVLQMRQRTRTARDGRVPLASRVEQQQNFTFRKECRNAKLAPVRVIWNEDET